MVFIRLKKCVQKVKKPDLSIFKVRNAITKLKATACSHKKKKFEILNCNYLKINII